MTAPADLFQPYLQPGEQVVWTGRPAQGLMFQPSDRFLVPFSAALGAFAMFWETGVLTSAELGEIRLYKLIMGAPFVIAALFLFVGRFVADAVARAATDYALTNRRALILRRVVGARLIEAPLAGGSQISLTARGALGDIDFGSGNMSPFGSGWTLAMPSFDGTVTFLGIERAEEVFALAKRGATR